MHVKILGDSQYRDFKQGDVGEIVGYVRGVDDNPYAVVVIKNKFVMVSIYNLEKI